MYHYTECGLDNVYLKNGYECDESAYGPVVTIHNIEGLHRAIGLSIVEYVPAPMSGEAFRFLRLELDLSQRALGEILGKSEQTVSLWERRRKTVPRDDDILIRAMYRSALEGSTRLGELIERLARLDRERTRMELEEGEGGNWRAVAA